MFLFDGGGRRNNKDKITPTPPLVLRVVVMAVMVSTAAAVGTYSVLAPSVIRPNRDYSVVVSAHNTDGPLRLGVEITGNLERGGANRGDDSFHSRQTAILEPDSSQIVKFQLGDLNHGDYHLSISGTGGGLDFRNITALKFEAKSYSVFIETDRAVYKPGDLVRFRVIVVNPNLRPSVTGAIDVHVQDGSGITVKRYQRVFTNKGVFTDQLQLAQEPVLGTWAILVSVLGQDYRGSFKVAEFVEPKFEVTLSLPDYLSLEDEVMHVTVEAYYPYGRPVKGEVTVQVTPRYKYDYLQAPYDAPVSIVRNIRGRTDLGISLVDDLSLRGDYARELEVTAYVKEELTDRLQNTTDVVTVYRFPYKMAYHRSSDTFKPGLMYTAYLRVTYQDGRPVTSGEVVARHAFARDQAAFVETRHPISPSGTVTLSVHPPLSGPSYTLALEARYQGLTQWLGEVPRAQSPSGTFLQATLLTEEPMVGEEVVVALNSTRPLVYFVYEVLARGDVLHGATLQAHQGTTHTFRFIASGSMFPRCRLLVYWVMDSGEVVADSLHFAVKRNNKDKVTLSVTPERVDLSGSSVVTITVSARPNSIIGLTAVDTGSLAIMGTQYRMDKSDIISELETYDPGRSFLDHNSALKTDDNNGNRFRRASGTSSDVTRERRGVRTEMTWYGTSTAHDVFENAGVVMMTNARVFQAQPVVSGTFTGGPGPIDGRGWDPEDHPPAHNGPFGRVPQEYGPDTSVLRPDLGPGLEYNAPPRPPLAGPYAFSHLPPPPDRKPRVYLSRLLPPTWLFTHRTTGLNGIVSWQERLPPSSLVSYSLTAFAVDDFDGLTVADQVVEVSAHRPFYVSLRVPGTVIRGEAVAVELVVFNNGQDNVTAAVTLDNQQRRFLFPDFNSNAIDQGSPASSSRRTIVVPGLGGRAPLSFMIVPQEQGEVEVRVTVVGGGYTDSTAKMLRVKAVGSRQHINKALYIDPSLSSAKDTYTLNLTYPRNIVEGSLNIELSAVGDALGGVITSPLEPLLALPMGCGEQNTAAMVPIIRALDQLKGRGELSRSLQEKASELLELRFQQALTYRQADGSFATFDEYRPSAGSTWLTAFVVKTLRSASPYIDVPRHVITDGLAWLVRQQQADGAFAEPASRRDQAVRKSAATADDSDADDVTVRTAPVALTSYVFLAVLEVEDYSSAAVRNAGNRALEFLVSVLQQQRPEEDVYALALATYAMHVADHPYKDTAFYLMEARAQLEDDMKWWPSSTTNAISTEDPDLVSSLAIEQTAYGLLTYTSRGLARDSAPIAKWLTSHRNARGGFSSTQDTAVGVAALASLSTLQSNTPPATDGAGNSGQVTVRVVYGERGHRFQINRVNARTMQRLQLPADTTSVSISTTGGHICVVQLRYSYNLRVTAPRPAFSLDPQLDRTTDANKLRLTACTGLVVRGNSSVTRSNMAVMEVELPSGYVIDHDALPGLYDYPGVRRVERLHHQYHDDEDKDRGKAKQDGGHLVDIERGVAIYFDYLSAVEVCPTVIASRVNRVAAQKPTVIKVYDYYDLTRQARQFYDAAPATLCDICDIAECDVTSCDKQISQLNRQRQAPEDLGYPATIVETSGAESSLIIAGIPPIVVAAALLHRLELFF